MSLLRISFDREGTRWFPPRPILLALALLPALPVCVAFAQSRMVQVPGIVGMPAAEARKLLASRSLLIEEIRQQTTAARPGFVFRQDPRAGSSALPKSTIRAWVAVAPQSPGGKNIQDLQALGAVARLVVVPDLIGRRIEEVPGILSAAHLAMGDRTPVTTGRTVGVVVRQSHEPSSRVAAGTPISVSFTTSTPAGATTSWRDPSLRYVPDLRGRTPRDAAQLLASVDLRLGTQTRVRTGGREGTVVGQTPDPNTPVKSGAAVDVQVEASTPTAVVPDLIGRSLQEATDRVASAGLRLGGPTVVRTGASPGTVVDQKPQPYAKVAPGSPVYVRVEESTVLVPDLSGRSLRQAAGLLTSSGLQLGAQATVSTGAPEGTVVAQRPAANSRVVAGTAVDVQLEATQQPVVVPDLTGSSLQAAGEMLASARLVLGTRTDVPGGPGPPGTIVGQSPEAGALVPAGTAVSVRMAPPVADARPIVPDVRGQTLSVASQRLVERGFSPGRVEDAIARGAPGTVAGQTPRAGSRAQAGSLVDLVLVAGTLRVTLSSSTTQSAPGEPVILSAAIEGHPSDVEYLFEFGDGERLEWSRASKVEHRYLRGGSFQPRVSVRDALKRSAASDPVLLQVVPAGNDLFWALVTGGVILGAFAATRVARVIRSRRGPKPGRGSTVTLRAVSDAGSQYMDDGVPAILHEIRFVPIRDLGEQSLDGPEQLVQKGG